MITLDLKVINNAGFHVRDASLVCKTAMKYQATLTLSKDGGGYEADCKSCLDLLTLMAPQGTVLTLRADGVDAEEAAAEIKGLFEHKFYEDEFAEQAS